MEIEKLYKNVKIENGWLLSKEEVEFKKNVRDQLKPFISRYFNDRIRGKLNKLRTKSAMRAVLRFMMNYPEIWWLPKYEENNENTHSCNY